VTAAGSGAAAQVTGLILAGGQGRRMGGVDKGLVDFGGESLTARVLARLRPQVGTVLINANRHADRYAALGCPVIPDALGDYPGPLAGMAAGLAAAQTEWLLTVPCDSPLLPADLCARLLTSAVAEDAEIAIATDGTRAHPVFALLRRSLAGSLEAFLAGDERKILRWMGRHRLLEVSFADCPERFVNVNTPAELAALVDRMARDPGGG
jgi:molybdopterin-guanine dinucleotide biosynthesis protein A